MLPPNWSQTKFEHYFLRTENMWKRCGKFSRGFCIFEAESFCVFSNFILYLIRSEMKLCLKIFPPQCGLFLSWSRKIKREWNRGCVRISLRVIPTLCVTLFVSFCYGSKFSILLNRYIIYLQRVYANFHCNNLLNIIPTKKYVI